MRAMRTAAARLQWNTRTSGSHTLTDGGASWLRRFAMTDPLFLVVNLPGIGIDLQLEALAFLIEALGFVTATVSLDLADLGVALRHQLRCDFALGQRCAGTGAGFLGESAMGAKGEDRNGRRCQQCLAHHLHS